jgi:hypothetical protein
LQFSPQAANPETFGYTLVTYAMLKVRLPLAFLLPGFLPKIVKQEAGNAGHKLQWSEADTIRKPSRIKHDSFR